MLLLFCCSAALLFTWCHLSFVLSHPTHKMGWQHTRNTHKAQRQCCLFFACCELVSRGMMGTPSLLPYATGGRRYSFLYGYEYCFVLLLGCSLCPAGISYSSIPSLQQQQDARPVQQYCCTAVGRTRVCVEPQAAHTDACAWTGTTAAGYSYCCCTPLQLLYCCCLLTVSHRKS